MEWPIVALNDDGIRPAGRPDQCFYCQQTVGQPHKPDCVIVTKRVKMRWTFEVECDEPHAWSEDDVLFRYNEGCWCADNAIYVLSEMAEANCLCGAFTCEVVSMDDEPHRKINQDIDTIKETGGVQ